jgi:glyoxylase-like metal-dependent hydrolase (beta-lactamase superfamily II)
MSIGRLGDPSAVRAIQFDDVTATYVVDGILEMRPGAFFPGIPSTYWSARPERRDAAGNMALSAGGLLIERAGSAILVDAGIGSQPVSFEFGNVRAGALLEVLESIERNPGDIDVVALTHLHFDHVGWAFTDGAKTFPNARYVMSALEWTAHADSADRTPPAIPEAGVTQMAIDPGIVDLVADDEEILPGVRTVVTPGHSPGHTSYVITSSGGRRLVAFGDVFHMPDQIAHGDWVSVVDADGVGVRAARGRLLAELCQPNTLGFGCHFGDQAFGVVAVDDSGTATWRPVPTTLLAPSPFPDKAPLMTSNWTRFDNSVLAEIDQSSASYGGVSTYGRCDPIVQEGTEIRPGARRPAGVEDERLKYAQHDLDKLVELVVGESRSSPIDIELLQDRPTERDGDVRRHPRSEGARLARLKHQAEVLVVGQLFEGVGDSFHDGVGGGGDRPEMRGQPTEETVDGRQGGRRHQRFVGGEVAVDRLAADT